MSKINVENELDKYPDICPNCGSPSYNGSLFGNIDCSNGCFCDVFVKKIDQKSKYGITSTGNTDKVKERLDNSGYWTDDGWVIKGELDLWHINLFALPPIKKVGRDFHCSGNQLTSLNGASKEVGGSFHCSGNAVKFKAVEIVTACRVYGKIFV